MTTHDEEAWKHFFNTRPIKDIHLYILIHTSQIVSKKAARKIFTGKYNYTYSTTILFFFFLTSDICNTRAVNEISGAVGKNRQPKANSRIDNKDS